MDQSSNNKSYEKEDHSHDDQIFSPEGDDDSNNIDANQIKIGMQDEENKCNYNETESPIDQDPYQADMKIIE
jgi:hypothetical protein